MSGRSSVQMEGSSKQLVWHNGMLCWQTFFGDISTCRWLTFGAESLWSSWCMKLDRVKEVARLLCCYNIECHQRYFNYYINYYWINVTFSLYVNIDPALHTQPIIEYILSVLLLQPTCWKTQFIHAWIKIISHIKVLCMLLLLSTRPT